jgi:hypothetical protein
MTPMKTGLWRVFAGILGVLLGDYFFEHGSEGHPKPANRGW